MKFPHDANITLNCLLLTLEKVKSKRQLGRNLFLQLDNTYKENKNIYVFRAMAYLIQQEIFETIDVSFLLVGHTHNDVDQVFSRISKKLFPCNVFSFEEMLRAIKESHRDVKKEKKRKKKRKKKKKKEKEKEKERKRKEKKKKEKKKKERKKKKRKKEKEKKRWEKKKKKDPGVPNVKQDEGLEKEIRQRKHDELCPSLPFLQVFQM